MKSKVTYIFLLVALLVSFSSKGAQPLSGQWELGNATYTIKKAGKVQEEHRYTVDMISSIPATYPMQIVSISINYDLYFAMLTNSDWSANNTTYNMKGMGTVSGSTLEIATDSGATLRYTYTVEGDTLTMTTEGSDGTGRTITQASTYYKK